MESPISIWASVAKGARCFWKHLFLCLGISLLFQILMNLAGMCCSIPLFFIGPPLSAAYSVFMLRLLRGQPNPTAPLFSRRAYMWPCILCGWCFAAMILASGLLLFLPAPLLIWAEIFAFTEIVDKGETRVRVAIFRSLHAALLAPVRLWALTLLSFILWLVLGFLIVVVCALASSTVEATIGGGRTTGPLLSTVRDFLLVLPMVTAPLLVLGTYIISPLMVISTFDKIRSKAQEVLGPRMDEKPTLEDLKASWTGDRPAPAAKPPPLPGVQEEAPQPPPGPGPPPISPPPAPQGRLVVTCTCGQKLKIPPSLVGKSGQCPKCKKRIVVRLPPDPQSHK